jgi:hypothetical protein
LKLGLDCPESASPVLIVGQHEDALPPVRRADVARSDTRPFRIEPERGKVGKQLTESMSIEPWHVFEEDDRGVALSDDSDDGRPDPPLVVGALPLAGDGPRLTREARRDEIHDSTPRLASEGRNVVPDRSEIQGLVFHPGHEDGRGEGFPLDVANGSIPFSESHSEPEIEPTDPRANR